MNIKSVVTKPYEDSILPVLIFEVDIAHKKFQEAVISVEGLLESDDGKMLANAVGVTTEKSKSEEVGARDFSFDVRFTDTDYRDISRDRMQVKQDNYGDAELLLSKVDFKFGAETLRLDSSLRILLPKSFDKSLRKKPKRTIYVMPAIKTNKR